MMLLPRQGISPIAGARRLRASDERWGQAAPASRNGRQHKAITARNAKGSTHIDGDSISERVAVGAVMRENPGRGGIVTSCLRMNSTSGLGIRSNAPYSPVNGSGRTWVHGAEDVLFGSRGSLRSYAMAPCPLATHPAKMSLVLWATRLLVCGT